MEMLSKTKDFCGNVVKCFVKPKICMKICTNAMKNVGFLSKCLVLLRKTKVFLKIGENHWENQKNQ